MIALCHEQTLICHSLIITFWQHSYIILIQTWWVKGGISVAMQISSLTSPTLEPDDSGMRPGQDCTDTDEKQSI